MNEPEISPLAKRLAEENNVNWRALSGSGAGGKVVERDVLEYLARVMAGEEDTDPTPEPLPEGVDTWPEEDIATYQDEVGLVRETPGLDTLQAELSASERPSGATGGTDTLTGGNGGGASLFAEEGDGEDLLETDRAPGEESTAGIEFAPLGSEAGEAPPPPAEESLEDEDISEDIFLFGEDDVTEDDATEVEAARGSSAAGMSATPVPEEFEGPNGETEGVSDPFAAAFETGGVGEAAPPEVSESDSLAGMDFETPPLRDDVMQTEDLPRDREGVWQDQEGVVSGDDAHAASESASYQEIFEELERADSYASGDSFGGLPTAADTSQEAPSTGDMEAADAGDAGDAGVEEDLFAPLDAAASFSPASSPVEEGRTADEATDVFAAAAAEPASEEGETDVFLSEPVAADVPTVDLDEPAAGGEQPSAAAEMQPESTEGSDEVSEWGETAGTAATLEVEPPPAEPVIPEEAASPIDAPTPLKEAALEEDRQGPDREAAMASSTSGMPEEAAEVAPEERAGRADTPLEEAEIAGVGGGEELGSVVRESATGAAVGAGKVPLVSYGLLLRRHVDLTTLAQAQLAVSRELAESDPIAPTAFLVRASAKALRAVPFAATNDVALAVIGPTGFGTRVVDDPATIPFRKLLKATREASGWGQDNRPFALVVADMSALEVDEAVLNVGAPVLTLGRILYDSQDGRYRSTLSLSGDVSPDLGAKFLALVADLLDSPVQLVL